MSVIVKGMEMPTSCLECPLTDGHSASCLITEKSVYFSIDKRHDDCPLVPVPPHGRLGDLDQLKELFREVIGNIAKRKEIEPVLEHMVRASAMVIEMIDDAPTIIESEE